MKKTFLFLMMTLLFCIGSSAFNDIKAQTTESTVTINANSTNSTSGDTQWYPVRCGHSVSISQQYYTKSEIGYGKGNITKIAFEGNNSSNAQTRSIKVYIQNIDSDNPSFSDGGNMIQLSEEDLYFSGDFSVTNCSGSTAWNTIKLDKSFSYAGNNILVCVNDITCSKGSDYYFTTYSCESRSVYQSIYSSTTPYDPTTSKIKHKTPTGYNPAIQFTFEEQSQDPITLIPSPDYITTCDKVTFTVMQGEGTGTDVTTSATIYQVDGTEAIELPDGNTFTPSEAGEYTFYAKKGSVQSENIIINVTEAPYVLKASPTNIMADGEDITTFSVTQCGNTVTGFTFYVDGNEIDGNTFSTAELGEHTVYATNGDITTSEITIYATEWKVTGWVTDLVLTEYYNTNDYGNKMSRKYENVAEITNGVFTLWLAITGTDLDNGIILNNNVYEYEIGTGGSAYMERSGHRPTTPQPLSIPGTLYIENIGEVTITEIANNVFYNTFIGDDTGSYQATGNSLNDNISSLTIPSTITTLGINAFGFDMSDNFVITCNAETPPTIQWAEVQTSDGVLNYQTAFGDYSSGNPGNYGGENQENEAGENISTYLYVPASSLTAYQEADFWEYFYRLVADPGSMIVYNGDGDWFKDKDNWSNGDVPADDEIVMINGNVEVSTDVTIKDITINEGCSITIVESGIFHINGTVTNNSENIITIKDGGQLYYNGEDELTVTVEKNIIGYGDDDNVKDGWYTISSPVYSVEDMDTYGDAPYYYVAINDVTNLIPTNHNYDLYRYYEPGTTMEVGWWENYKQGESQLDEMLPDFTILSNGHGYLYASSDNVNLEFSGKVLTGSVIHHCYKMNLNEDFNGFNLMGNPFTHDITLNNVTNLKMANGFYTVTNAGTWETHSSTDNIKPTQGMLIKITDTSIDSDGFGFLTISEEETRSNFINNGSINIVVSNDRYTDNAIVSFSEGKGLNKFPHLNKEAHEVYVIDNDTKYGVATMNDDVTTIPVGFKANTMGQYTISAEAKDCKFNSMTLTDKMTGVKTNFLTDSYTFMATTNDNPNRFTLTLNADTDTDNDFIYINNNEMIINNIEGDGLVQIYDVMGRSVATYNVSGSANISMEALSEGIYIVRMTDANGVKTQKVVNN